jgi:hypothetical protein
MFQLIVLRSFFGRFRSMYLKSQMAAAFLSTETHESTIEHVVKAPMGVYHPDLCMPNTEDTDPTVAAV